MLELRNSKTRMHPYTEQDEPNETATPLPYANQSAAGKERGIKFVSMIDQKPVQPSYLELIPLKHFAQKESEAQRKATKDQRENKNDTESNQMGIYWCNQLTQELQDKFKVSEEDLAAIKSRKE